MKNDINKQDAGPVVAGAAYDWCGDKFATIREVEDAIAHALCEYLVNGDAGMVHLMDDVECDGYCIEVHARVLVEKAQATGSVEPQPITAHRLAQALDGAIMEWDRVEPLAGFLERKLLEWGCPAEEFVPVDHNDAEDVLTMGDFQ